MSTLATQTRKLTEADAIRAKRIWEDYRKREDVSEKTGQTVGIDPDTGQVWFGESGIEIVEHIRSEGLEVPLYFQRVGSEVLIRKGGRR